MTVLLEHRSLPTGLAVGTVQAVLQQCHGTLSVVQVYPRPVGLESLSCVLMGKKELGELLREREGESEGARHVATSLSVRDLRSASLCYTEQLQ